MTSGRNNYWTSGNALTWVVGVLLGGLIGTILLIAIPRTLGGGAAAPAAAAPAEAAAPEQPAETTPAATQEATAQAAPAGAGDAAAGKEKFAGTCGGCHGMEAQGGMGPALAVTKTWTDAQFTAAVREGKAPDKALGAVMPHFTTGMLSDTELANIHAFLKTVN